MYQPTEKKPWETPFFMEKRAELLLRAQLHIRCVEEYPTDADAAWIREAPVLRWARQEESRSLHVNMGSSLPLLHFYGQQKELMLCAARAEGPCRLH